ncbi:ABC transporter permease [Rhizobium pusense]|uniref:Permease component of ribose/xylose/arabinose/galactoside ABC-type transporter n=1 Tax=Agrobacterium genomosp. 2 str. CFBP 5494 TaxID=1183436 RepID=A0A9W5B617_9HYPH|nr:MULTISPECIES: ABC transporter permease [Rhizobium/Agrobacterium group]ANV26512.1 ABC transporter permease [Rhizobium sp. S41]KGE83054.1 ABC transporter permease [Rhizobium sp. H41]KIV65327.1 Ribose ABC transport system, permease protein RbsC [Rhizobium sp. UR51a]HCJ70868.1 ABC transporter permease [Agrobacterium sp.]MBP2613832.1 ribose transport system permease protein [Agrobacterium pusense]
MATSETPSSLAGTAVRRTAWWEPALKARETGLIVIILALFAVMSFISPYFLTVDNLRAMAMVFAIESIVVVGMTILLISGGIDLSVGSVTALAMVAAGWLFLNGVDPWVAAGLAICLTTLVGMVMGFLTTVIGLHHFIVSLGVMVIARGVCLLATGGRPLGLYSLPPEFKFIGQGVIGGIPLVLIIFMVVVVSFDLLLRRTTAFRKVFYTGSNPKAAAYSGIRVGRVVFTTTTLCSMLCGVAGVIYMARFGSAQPSFGIGMELNVIAAAVIGGASLSGGSGTILGAILGAILLSVVSSSLALLNVSVYWQDIIRGSILLAAVLFDHYLVRRRR